MSTSLPTKTKVLVIKPPQGEQESQYNRIAVESQDIPSLKPNEVLLKINAVALNHRDVWLRKGLYPGRKYDTVLGADGAGIVIASGQKNNSLLQKRVFLSPSRGWISHPDAPEGRFAVIGGVVFPSIGTFSEYVVVERGEIIESPGHLSDTQVAAWPLAGVTSWRAAVVNGRVQAGQNVLITGIGGGVALVALQLCLAKGANCYVTSGSQEKIDKAVKLGAKGGVNYKDDDWSDKLAALLAKSTSSKSQKVMIDVVIDSGGADIMSSVSKVLKMGGIVVCYGMTGEPKITFTMREVMRNQRLIGSTMGSRQDLIDATAFLSEHKITPVVSHAFDGLTNAEAAFETMKSGSQFGKVVITIQHEAAGAARL